MYFILNVAHRISIELYEMVTLASPTKLEDFIFSIGKTLYIIQRKPGRQPGMR